jgi:hypothetical protein
MYVVLKPVLQRLANSIITIFSGMPNYNLHNRRNWHGAIEPTAAVGIWTNILKKLYLYTV